MEGGHLLCIFSVLLLSQVTLSAADDYYEGGRCGLSSQSLGDGCSISSDCSTITCSTTFVEKPLTLKLEVNQCDDPVTVTASMDVQDLGITWSHTYTSDDIVEVPGFTFSLPGLSAGVYVQVELTPNDDSGQLHLKVKLLGGGEVLGHASYPIKLPIMDGDLPISTDDCGFIYWWKNAGNALQAAVIGGPLLLLILLIMCCYCCCCRTRPANAGRVIMQPAVAPTVIATSTKSTVPMRPFVNEA